MNKAIPLLAHGDRHRTGLARLGPALPFAAALFSAETAAAETVQSGLGVGATVLSSCLVSTQARGSGSSLVALSCGALAPESVLVEQIAASTPRAASKTSPDSPRLTRVTITY